jgi:3-hydroxymyristoyl/3-hydroxydecanoyl-(acyl carrier protein) dehydratase
MNPMSPVLDRDQVATFLDIHIPINISQAYDVYPDKLAKRQQLEQISTPSTEAGFIDHPIQIEQQLTQLDIHNLTPEREPGLRIKRAVICAIGDIHLILAPLVITEEMCAGHMPGFPILPLAEAGRALAQVGSILIGYMAKVLEQRDGNLTPLVYKVGEIVSGQQGFLYPQDRICLIAQGKKMRGPLYAVQAHGYLGDQHIFSMPKIHYFVSQDNRLWNMEA